MAQLYVAPYDTTTIKKRLAKALEWNHLRLIEPLNYFETHYWRFRQTYFFENN